MHLPESGPTASPARALLIGGAVPGLSVGAVCVAASAIASPAAAASAGLGAVLAAAALAVGPLVMMIAKTWSPPAVMLLAMIGYAVATVTIGVVYVATTGLEWVRGGYAGCALIATLIAWIMGQVRASGRLRILAFGNDVGSNPPSDQAIDRDDGDSPASPREASH